MGSATPRYVKLVLALLAVCLIGIFSTEISDPDFWWHLKTGEYIWREHRLPVPDPFSYTSSYGAPAYPGEETVRYFNLTHEWLAQLVWYWVYALGGFPAVVLWKATILVVFCGIVGLLAWRRSGEFWWAPAASLAAAVVALNFAMDRPALITFLMVAVFMAVLEFRRGVWLLPPLMLVWANCHSGFFLGWVVLVAYTFEKRDLWKVTAACVAVSAVNPNLLSVFKVLFLYQKSYLTSTLIEWTRPSLWGPPYAFDLLLYAAAAVLVAARRRVRRADWVLFAAFAAAALLAFRNLMLVALVAPALIAAYSPRKRLIPLGVAAAGLVAAASHGSFFQLRAAEWRYPSGAADFLLRNRIAGPVFNTYEYGGYLMWRLWPQNRVFIDGRALNEAVFRDYRRVLYAAKETPEILARYGPRAVVMNGFEYNTGALYALAVALDQSHWKLVYEVPRALVFLRDPPPDMAVLPAGRVFDHLEAECALHIEKDPDLPMCARALGDFFLRTGQPDRARRALGLYMQHRPGPDPSAEKAYRDLLLR